MISQMRVPKVLSAVVLLMTVFSTFQACSPIPSGSVLVIVINGTQRTMTSDGFRIATISWNAAPSSYDGMLAEYEDALFHIELFFPEPYHYSAISTKSSGASVEIENVNYGTNRYFRYCAFEVYTNSYMDFWNVRETFNSIEGEFAGVLKDYGFPDITVSGRFSDIY